MIKAVIFDLDDTLYDEMQFVKGGLKKAALHISKIYKVNREKTYRLFIKILHDHGRGKIFDLALSGLGLPVNRQILDKLVSVYRYNDAKLRPFKETIPILFYLRHKGYKVALLTDGNSRVQRHKVRMLGIEPFFDCLVYSRWHGIDFEKPNQLIYKKCLKKMGLEPYDAIYVGDNPSKDFIGAKELGIRTLMLKNKRRNTARITGGYEAEYIVSSLGGIPAVIRMIDKQTGVSYGKNHKINR